MREETLQIVPTITDEARIEALEFVVVCLLAGQPELIENLLGASELDLAGGVIANDPDPDALHHLMMDYGLRQLCERAQALLDHRKPE